MATPERTRNACDFNHKPCPTCEVQELLRQEEAARKAAEQSVEPGDARA